MKLGIAVLRVVVGVLFMGHGLQKLRGWFGGHGPEGTAQMFEGLGLHPPKAQATAAGAAETAGGALLATGFLTPVAGTLITSVMATAIRTVHGKNGPWATNGGYEYNLVLIAAAFAIVDSGPGALSLDRALGIERSGAAIAIASLAAGVAGSRAVVELGRRAGAPEPEAPPEEKAPPRFTERDEPAPAEAETQTEAAREQAPAGG
jgi:putative oxidoreductase